MRRAFLLAALALAPVPAVAEEPEPTVRWFQANPGARRNALAACRNDHRLAAEAPGRAVCANAESAESKAWAWRSEAAFRRMFDNREYWQSNPGRRAALKAACDRRASFDRPMLRFCGYAG